MPRKLESKNSSSLVIRPQVVKTADGFAITDPCLAMQVAKGSGSVEKLLKGMDDFFSAK